MATFDMQQVIENYDSITKEFKVDLATEFRSGRIKGTEYADTYQKLMAIAMQEAFQTPLLAAQTEQIKLQNEKLALEKELVQCEIDKCIAITECEVAKCEAQTAQILSATTIQEAQSDKDLLVKAAGIAQTEANTLLIGANEDNVKNKTTIESAQSAKDLEVKDKTIEKYTADIALIDADEDATRSNTTIKENHSTKDLAIKDQQLLNLEAEENQMKRQTAGFDDDANIKLFNAQMNAWSLAFSSGQMPDFPTIIKDESATALYNCIKKDC